MPGGTRGPGADVIVIGGGTAGSVVAGRLAAAGARVVLVEAGPGRSDTEVLDSLDATGALALPDRFDTTIEAVAGSRRLLYRSGRGLGGGSAINAMVATAGDRADYDQWAAVRGCPGWDGAAMEPWLRRAVDTVGIIEIEPGPVARALEEAAAGAGHRRGGPSVALDATGILTASLTARHGRRRSAADAYLDPGASPVGTATGPGGSAGPAGPLGSDGPLGGFGPAAGGGRLDVAVGATVVRVAHDGSRVTGVVLADGTALAASRVVLCAGALRTPALLAASGLGPPGPWPVTDHPSFVLTLALRSGPAPTADRPAPAISGLLRWSSDRAGSQPASSGSAGPPSGSAGPFSPLAGPGPAAAGPGPGGRAGLPADLLALAMDHVGPGPEGRRYGALIVVLTDVASVGRVTVAPGGGVTVAPGWLDSPADRTRMRAGVRHVAALAASGAFESVAEGVFADDAGTAAARLADLDDDDLDRWLADHPGPVRHPAASLPLGGAVDLGGGVPGIAGLTVADASVLPRVPNANPMIPVLAVAERLVDGLVTGRAPGNH